MHNDNKKIHKNYYLKYLAQSKLEKIDNCPPILQITKKIYSLSSNRAWQQSYKQPQNIKFYERILFIEKQFKVRKKLRKREKINKLY